MSKKGIRAYRPELHFTPASGWINDPNGLVYENGRYHLFYQHYPKDTKWGPMHWGHAISRDLIKWEELPIALAPDELGYVFSGSAVYDSQNTSGFGVSGQAPIVAMFTHHGETEQQSIAYSTNGIDFIKYEDNPVIKNPGIKDFRDPKMFYNPVKDCWSVVIAAGDHAEFYVSKDLMNWEKTGEFGPEGNLCQGVWECPDVFPLSTPDGKELWVLTVSMTLPAEIGGSKTQYFIGTFDGDKFICTHPFNEIEWIDPGFDNYAAVSYYSEELPERIMMGWGNNWSYAADIPTGEYCGFMTLPRKVTLVDTAKGLRLSSKLVLALGDALRPVEIIKKEKALTEECFGIRIEGDQAFTAILSNDDGEELRFGIDNKNKIFLDRSNAGDQSFSEVFASEVFQKVIKERFFKGDFVMEVVFDVSILEVFCDEGTFACAMNVFPKKPYDKITVNGDVKAFYIDLK